jgi:hypothetical protein
VFSAGAGTTAGLYLLARALASEPVLYAANVGRLAVSPSAMLHRTAELLLGLPETLAELFTSQEVLSPLGVILGALAAVGMVVQWRHGQRMLTVTVVLYVLGLLALGSRRPRYLLPVQPILLLLTVEGLFWTLRRFRRQAPVDWTAERRVLAGLVVVLVGCNAPRLLRDAAYYPYLSYTPRYYQVIRDGAHADLFEVGRALRLAGRADRPVLAGGEMVSLLHYVSGQRIVGLPRTTGQSPQEAEEVLAAIAGDRSADLLVIDRQDGGQQYRRRLVEGIGQAGQWRAFFTGRRLTVYARAPEPPPAARQKDDGSGGSLPAPPESLVR